MGLTVSASAGKIELPLRQSRAQAQPLMSLINRMETELAGLTGAGVLKELESPLVEPSRASRVTARAKNSHLGSASNQAESCFGD